MILADRVGANIQFMGYLTDFKGLVLRDRKTENGELCSLRSGGEAEDHSLEQTGKSENGTNGKRPRQGCGSPGAPRADAHVSG